MASWQEALAKIASNVEHHFDYLKYRLGSHFGGHDPLQITPYLGYGTAEKLYLKGRVLEDENVITAQANDTIWDNLLITYRRFASDEIPDARVEVRFGEQQQVVVSDQEGFFDLWLHPTEPLPADQLWHNVALTLLAPVRDERTVQATGRILVPPPSARFGIISDIDDTVVHTDATSLAKMARIVFLGNARTRLPFAGVSAFYRALQQGHSGHEMNPIFYVSSSPWNLFDLLHDFMELQGIPLGPLMLRDWGLSRTEILPTGHAAHKLASIRQILDLYPQLPFLLIGDSGQEDPEIYAEIVEAYPNRIRAVYIRNVSQANVARQPAIEKLATEVRQAGSDLLLVESSRAAADHAAAQGWMNPAGLDEIDADVEADEQPAVDEDLDIVEEEKDRSEKQARKAR